MWSMSNRTTHRQMLTATEPKHSKPSTDLDAPALPSKPSPTSNPTSRVNASQRLRSSQSLTDARLQAKSMSASMDSSKSSLKSNLHPKSFDPRSEKQSKKTEESEKPRKPSKNVVAVVKKKKEAQKGLVGIEEEKEFDSVRRPSVSSAASGGGGRRRSLSGSQVQLADVFASNGVRVVSADMPPFMQIHAVECARKTLDSLEKFTAKTLALTLKKEFDGVYGPAWHCIVGTSFGSFVTHSGLKIIAWRRKNIIPTYPPLINIDGQKWKQEHGGDDEEKVGCASKNSGAYYVPVHKKNPK